VSTVKIKKSEFRKSRKFGILQEQTKDKELERQE
jgi:hypothetical protein